MPTGAAGLDQISVAYVALVNRSGSAAVFIIALSSKPDVTVTALRVFDNVRNTAEPGIIEQASVFLRMKAAMVEAFASARLAPLALGGLNRLV